MNPQVAAHFAFMRQQMRAKKKREKCVEQKHPIVRHHSTLKTIWPNGNVEWTHCNRCACGERSVTETKWG